MQNNYIMLQTDRKIYYTLRFAAAMCFIGHGSFGIITKQIWCNYFAVFGIDSLTAYKLMPFMGIIDILMGISLLVYPTRIIVWWLVVWGCITAFLRPVSGEPFAEFIERAGNFGTPLALLILCSAMEKNVSGWFRFLKPAEYIDAKTMAKVTTCLKVVVFLSLAGHGWLNLIEKKGIINQYASLGFSNPLHIAHLAGTFELLAACTVLVRPLRQLIFVFLIWKIGTELFYPHWELFEWLERGGSYGALLALWLALPRTTLPAADVDLTASTP